MMGEGGERGRHREGQDESDDDIEKMMKDITDEIEKELEREQQEEREHKEADEAMRKAIKELEEEDEERRRAYEEYMGKIQEKEEERGRQEREESVDKDSLDEFEKKELERMKNRGENPEDVLNRWREQYVREVEDYIGDTPEVKEEDEREGLEPASEKPADDISYFGDGSGQMYATKTEHMERTSGEIESESEDIPSKEQDSKEFSNPSEVGTKPVEGECTRSDADEDIDSKPQPSSETSKPSEADESPMEKRRHREIAAESNAEGEMRDESESSKKDSKKEFYNRPEEEWRRKYRERFEEREEEEKEEFRKVLVDQVKEKDDVEKLARKNDYESLLEDEDAMEEIEQYLKTRMVLETAEEDEIKKLAEELGVDAEKLKEGDLKEILPESLKELLNREGDLIWREFDRRFIATFLPESSEELGSAEMGHAIEERLKEEAEAWFEIMALRNAVEIEFVMRDGREWYSREQIQKLSEKYGIEEEVIVNWLRFESIPSLIERVGHFWEEEAEEVGSSEYRRKVDYHEVHRLHHIEGMSAHKIAKKMGVAPRTIYRIFKRHSWKVRELSRPTVDESEVYRLYFEKKMSQQEVADRLGITVWNVRGIFKMRKWKARLIRHGDDAERRRENSKQFRKRIQQLRNRIFGTKCRICGEKRKLAIHKKDGSEHEKDSLWRMEFLKSLNPDEWAPLCIPCHRGVHWLMDRYLTDWREVELLAEKARGMRPESKAPIKLPDDKTPASSRYLALKDKFGRTRDTLRRAIFGDSCYFCGTYHSKARLVIHRKDGRPHDSKLLVKEKYYRTLNPKNWVPLCQKHHRYVHWAMDNLALKWEDLE